MPARRGAPTGGAASARGTRIATPPAESADGAAEDEEADSEVSPAPYDWGVSPAKRPPGAWLLGEEGSAAELKARSARTEPAAPPAQVPGPARAPADVTAGGGRSYLVKKLSAEVLRAQPALRALRERGIVSDAELGEGAGDAAGGGRPGAGAADDSSDDEVSIDHFAERQEMDLEKELSPVKLVSELRRIRRLVETLVAKGVISEGDLERPGDEVSA
jgi:hypothetical protein